jgi:hypothetical protein
VDRRLPDGLHPLRNPLSSEAEAFRFLVAVIGAAVIVAIAAKLNTWVGVGAAVAVVGGLGVYLRR